MTGVGMTWETAVYLGGVCLTGCVMVLQKRNLTRNRTSCVIGFRELELQEIVTCSGTFISWARKDPLHKGEDFSLFDHTKLITHHNFPSSTNSNGPHLAKMWGRHVVHWGVRFLSWYLKRESQCRCVDPTRTFSFTKLENSSKVT